MGKGERTRERILEHAAAMASRDGLEGLTIGGLAEEVGLSKSGLYAHFESKEHLQVDVLRREIDRFREIVVRPALAAPRGEPRVRVLFERWLAWGSDSGMPGGCLITSAASELDDRPGAPRDLLAATLREWVETVVEVAEAAVAEGHFRADLDARQFAYELYAVFLAFHLAHRMMRDPEAERRARVAFDRLMALSRA